MRRFVRDHSLSIATIGAFLVIWLGGQAWAGHRTFNDDQRAHGEAPVSFGEYLTHAEFGEATFENWESEFLQMGSYVLLTAYLVQRGSPESKPLRQKDRPEDYPERATQRSPALSRRSDWAQAIYRNSLSIALLGLFVLSFLAHLLSGTANYNEEQALESGAPPVSVLHFLGTSDFWFQSMQNWQSEFLAVGCLVLLSIVLRQHGSPQSKPVTATHAHTGE
jgi:hypothetical protein